MRALPPSKLVRRHGVADVRRTLARMADDPSPPRLRFDWMYVPRDSSLDDVVPGTECAVQLRDGRVLVGRFVEETPTEVRFRPWGLAELVLPRAAVAGARVLGPHRWGERQEIARRQAGAL